MLHRSAHHHAGKRREPEGPLLLPGVPFHRAAEPDRLHLLSALHYPAMPAQHLQHLQGRAEASSGANLTPECRCDQLVLLYIPQQCNRKRRSVETTAVQRGTTDASVLTVPIRTETDMCMLFYSNFCTKKDPNQTSSIILCRNSHLQRDKYNSACRNKLAFASSVFTQQCFQYL